MRRPSTTRASGPAPARSFQLAQALGDLRRVLVAAARQGDEHGRTCGYRATDLARQPTDRVRGFERGHDALGRGEELEALERLGVVGRVILRPPARRERGVLGPDARVVEA